MRADRLLSMMLFLSARNHMTARELATRLEVSERTIYRDINALSAAGVPIYTQPGTYGGVFLDENYRISLTGLSPTQIHALFMSRATGPLNDLGLADAIEQTLLKLFTALPSRQRNDVAQLQQRFYVDPTNWFQNDELSPFFAVLQQAVWEDRLLHMIYQTVEQGEIERTLESYALVAKGNVWYLVGKKPGGTMRNYRIDRLSQVQLKDTHFERDHDFDLVSYWEETRMSFEQHMRASFPPYLATLRIHTDVLWVFPAYKEGCYEQIESLNTTDWVTLRVTYDSLSEAHMHVLGLGTAVEVIEPQELHRYVLATAQAIVARENNISD
ncbi:MAG: YafY family protein [Chloroflexota bacterium]